MKAHSHTHTYTHMKSNSSMTVSLEAFQFHRNILHSIGFSLRLRKQFSILLLSHGTFSDSQSSLLLTVRSYHHQCILNLLIERSGIETFMNHFFVILLVFFSLHWRKFSDSNLLLLSINYMISTELTKKRSKKRQTDRQTKTKNKHSVYELVNEKEKKITKQNHSIP